MTSSGRNSGRGNQKGAGSGRGGNQQKRPGRPRPEERRYDVGGSGGEGLPLSPLGPLLAMGTLPPLYYALLAT
ncbi:hypothetical protein ACWEP3_32235, partial [Streptomyces albidoflavus]